MNVADQLTMLQLLMGEPTDPTLARFNPTQYLIVLNMARSWLAEEARCVQIKDNQTTIASPPTSIYSVQQDIIDLYRLEYNGVPLDLIQPFDWRQRIGDDDTIMGPSECAKFWGRQLQLFPVPDQAKPLIIEGWAYPADISDPNGGDLDFNNKMAETSVYRAAWIAKDADERDSKDEKEHAIEGMLQLQKQYRPRGPRMVRKRANNGMNQLQRWLLRG